MAATRTPAKFYSPLAIGAPEPFRTLPSARAHDSLRAAAQREDPRQNQGHRGPGRRHPRQPRGRHPRRRRRRQRAKASSPWRARPISARPVCGRASTASTSPGCSTTSRRSWRPSATSSTSSCCPRSRGRGTSTTSTSCWPSSRPSTRVKKPILIHAILETAEGVNNVEAIAAASPRMHGMSLGPADLAASRGMKTTRVGGGHPDYRRPCRRRPATAARRAPSSSRTSGTTRSARWSMPASPMA